ncbi:MAG: hypothetical protein NC209_08500 [Alistipes sp.]|nr:hypothetical protein [Alistipes senegalensis]MCM1251161.1 hypothetical protein [Alistipes sp.]
MIPTTKYLRILLLAGALLANATSCDEDDAFYVQHYAIERVEALVEAAAQSPEESEAADENPRIEQIRAEIMAASPVETGGGYTLRFTEYNGGPLEIVPTAGTAALSGAFRKTPGSSTLEFLYDGMRRVYTLGSYRTEDRETKVLLQLDLTEYCRERYPEVGITRAVRREYTSTPY